MAQGGKLVAGGRTFHSNRRGFTGRGSFHNFEFGSKASQSGSKSSTREGAEMVAMLANLAIEYKSDQLTDCNRKWLMVAVDVGCLVLSVADLRASISKDIVKRAVVKRMATPRTTKLFLRATREFRKANSYIEQAQNVYSMAKSLYDAGVFHEIDDIMWHEMTWMEWVKTLTMLTAPIALCFVSGRAAFFAKAALILTGDGHDLIVDVQAALEASDDQ